MNDLISSTPRKSKSGNYDDQADLKLTKFRKKIDQIVFTVVVF